MKFVQQLLVAPAALGLMAPMAVASSQFSDVVPSDWAYQALSNLVETLSLIHI